MTKFAGQAASTAEAEAFLQGGADAVEARGGAQIAGALAADFVFFADAKPDFGALARLAPAALVSLTLTDEAKGRLLDYMPVPALQTFVSLCHGNKLRCCLSGALEAPDVPRLLPLKPDYLAFAGPLNAEAIAVIRALIPAEGEKARGTDLSILSARGHAPGDGGDYDKLIVRDFIIDMSVGAYAYEHGKPQRVKFDVVAEVRRRTAAPKDIRDIFSYDIIMDTIRTIVADGHVDLLETLAEKISQSLLRHPDIAVLHLKLEKLDLGPAIVGVEITRKRAVEAAKVRQLYQAKADKA
jgi:(5-formylfuran-3-yl)methyl phosphate synthase